MRASAAAGAFLLLLCAAAPATQGAGGDPWRTLAPGLELGGFPAAAGGGGAGREITVLRIDPKRWELTLHGISETGERQGRSARAWAAREGLVAAINAGMFDLDERRHVGYLKDGDHVNSPRPNGYRSVAAFGPLRPGLPPFRIFDLEEAAIPAIAEQYASLAQNLRLIARPGVAKWEPSPKRWSEAALAEDGEGRALFVFCRAPLSMHELNARLLALPLGIVAAQHLEGGAEAQLHVRVGDVRLDLTGSHETSFNESDLTGVAWPIPNVIGVRAR